MSEPGMIVQANMPTRPGASEVAARGLAKRCRPAHDGVDLTTPTPEVSPRRPVQLLPTQRPAPRSPMASGLQYVTEGPQGSYCRKANGRNAEPEGRNRGPTRGSGSGPAERRFTRMLGTFRPSLPGAPSRAPKFAQLGWTVGAGGGRGQRRGSFIGGRSPEAPRALAACTTGHESADDPSRGRPLSRTHIWTVNPSVNCRGRPGSMYRRGPFGAGSFSGLMNTEAT